MPSIDEIVSERFLKWERRGRGWQVFPYPVHPEPLFVPFPGTYVPPAAVDDGRRPTFLSSLMERLNDSLAGPSQTPPPIEPQEPESEPFDRNEPVELQLVIPEGFSAKPKAIAPIFARLGLCQEPIAFELIGTEERVAVQFAASFNDAQILRRHLKAQFPEIIVSQERDLLRSRLEATREAETLVVEFGLSREFAYPLAQPDSDPFVGLIAALDELKAGELAVFQVIFEPASAPWAESLMEAVTDAAGKPFFRNEPELTELAQEKTSSPLFAAVVRMAVRAEDFDRVLDIARDVAGSLRVYSRLDGNALIPLTNSAYPLEDHLVDVLFRQCQRTGMLLNTEELMGFVHVPTAEVHSPKLKRDFAKTKAVPKQYAEVERGLALGENSHAGYISRVSLSPEDRTRHVHIIGASGTGKSTLLFNLIRQDIENDVGMALLDPHGDLVDRVLGVIPKERINDVVLIDPSDEEYSVGFNILSAHSELEKTLLASDLVSVFQRLSTTWGDQMASVLQNAILAFLESSRGGTISDLRRFLLEPDYRKEFLYTVKDADIVYYWLKGFPQLAGNKSIGPVITRLNDFLSRKPIRHMVSQPENRLNFADITDTGKILLAKLPQGLMGRENAFLMGSLLVAKFQQLAMARQAQEIASRRDFILYVDEFQNFITPSMAEILGGARKYRLGLVLAHQELRHLERDREVASAVLTNCHTRVVFRVSDSDARALENGFSFFEASDLQNLATGRAVCRIEKAGNDFNLEVPRPEFPANEEAKARRQEIIAASRSRYGTLRADVEAALRAQLTPDEPPKTVPKAPRVIPPEPTVSKEEVAPVAKTPPEPEKPHEFGRGGAGHQSIQKRIRTVAEELGFLAVIEKPVLDGKGSVDVALERDGLSIACEVAITTPVAHEVENVEKCLKAGFSHVAVVATTVERLAAIQKAVEAALPSSETKRVAFYTPDALEAYLRTVPVPEKSPSSAESKEKVIKGIKVRFHSPPLSDDERKAREALALQQMQNAMKSKSLPRQKKDRPNHLE